MKKLLSILLISFSLSANAQTSVYHQFPDSNAVWNVELDYYVFCTPFTYPSITHYSYVIGGDTMIGSETYHQLFVPAYQTSYSGAPCYNDTVTAGNYAGAFREDTAAKKVYYVYPFDNTEQLLYDFTLNVGDTVHGYLARDCSQMSTDQSITDIDSVLIGADYRKRWSLGNIFYIIEGIGSTKGLLEPICELIDGPTYILDCFQQNDTVLYPTSSSNCDLVSYTGSLIQHDFSFSLFPNPAHEYFTVTNGGLLEIYSLYGTKVYAENIRSHMKVIHCNLNPGIYFVRLQNGNNNFVQKLIIE
jgi:hypothetical protein